MTRSGKSAYQGEPHIGPSDSETWDAGCWFARPSSSRSWLPLPTRKPARLSVRSFLGRIGLAADLLGAELPVFLEAALVGHRRAGRQGRALGDAILGQAVQHLGGVSTFCLQPRQLQKFKTGRGQGENVNQVLSNLWLCPV